MRTISLCIQGVTEKPPHAYRDAKIPVCIRGLVYIQSRYAYRDAKIAVCIQGLPPRLSSAPEMRKVINLTSQVIHAPEMRKEINLTSQVIHAHQPVINFTSQVIHAHQPCATHEESHVINHVNAQGQCRRN